MARTYFHFESKFVVKLNDAIVYFVQRMENLMSGKEHMIVGTTATATMGSWFLNNKNI